MRKVFTSPRLENVEAVANLLRAQGIEVKIAESRSYRGNRRSTFSYRIEEDAAPQPSVWIVHADDQPRGRQLLREAGLLDSSRAGESSYLPLSLLERDKDGSVAAKARRTSRIRIVLLGLIAITGGLVFFATRKPAPVAIAAPALVAAVPARPTIVPQLADELSVYSVNVPSALAAMLVEAELHKRRPKQACITIDDKDPSPGLVAALNAGTTQVFTKTGCPASSALGVGVHNYMTDGSGTGTVQVAIDKDDARTFEVIREDTRWRVLGVR